MTNVLKITTYAICILLLIICQHHFQSQENDTCHVLCFSWPYFKVGVARTVPKNHVVFFCSVYMSVFKIRSTPNNGTWSSLQATLVLKLFNSLQGQTRCHVTEACVCIIYYKDA